MATDLQLAIEIAGDVNSASIELPGDDITTGQAPLLKWIDRFAETYESVAKEENDLMSLLERTKQLETAPRIGETIRNRAPWSGEEMVDIRRR